MGRTKTNQMAGEKPRVRLLRYEQLIPDGRRRVARHSGFCIVHRASTNLTTTLIVSRPELSVERWESRRDRGARKDVWILQVADSWFEEIVELKSGFHRDRSGGPLRGGS